MNVTTVIQSFLPLPPRFMTFNKIIKMGNQLCFLTLPLENFDRRLRRYYH